MRQYKYINHLTKVFILNEKLFFVSSLLTITFHLGVETSLAYCKYDNWKELQFY